MIRSAQRGLHDAAGGAEDDARAGGRAKRLVELLLRQRGGVDVLGANHAINLARGEGDVNVRVPAGVVHDGDGDLVLLGRARHDLHAEDLVRIDPLELGEVALGHGTEHLARRLGG